MIEESFCMSGQAVPMSMCLSLEKKQGTFFSHSYAGANTSKEVWDECRGWVTFSSTREPVKTLGQISRWENGAVWMGYTLQHP